LGDFFFFWIHLGKAAKEVIVRARNQVGQLISSKPDDILFTSGGTEANNLIFYSILKYFEVG